MDKAVPQEEVPALEVPDVEAPEVLRATPRGRLYLAGLTMLVLALIATFQFFVFPLLTASLKAAPALNAVSTLKIIFIGFAAIVISVAVFVIWYGSKILRCGQFPVPGAWVWRDTSIKRGQSVIKVAWLHFLTAALIIIIGIALAVFMWRGLDRLRSQYELPNGVTIVR